MPAAAAGDGDSDDLHAAVSVQSVAGTLTLTRTEISWRPSSSSSSVPSFALALRFLTGLSVSVAGSASTVMLLKLDQDAPKRFNSKLVLYFVAEPLDAAVQQREPFKERLTQVIKHNKARAAAATAATANTDAASTSSPAAAVVRGSGPASPAQAGPSRSRDASAAASPSTTTTPAPTTATAARSTAYDEPPARTELQMRIDILKAHPALLALHRQVVHSRIMTDAEFWSHPTRLSLLRAERAAEKQKRGRNARLADPQKKTDQGGEVRYSLTPQIVRDMFEQYPVVARAYAENVPDKLSEQDFWRRYFSSRLYSRLRTSARSAASEHVIRDDDIFDQYLQEEDDDLEPRRAYNPHDALLDLASTANDHDQTGNARDWTMRPGFGGGGKRALPLLRRFNEHSQSLLDSALGEQHDQEGQNADGSSAPARKKRRIVGGVGEEYGDDDDDAAPADSDDEDDEEGLDATRSTRHLYNNIVIDELEEGRQRRTVPLNVQSAKRRKGKGLNTEEASSRAARAAGHDDPMDLDNDDAIPARSHEEIRQLINDELDKWPVVASLGTWRPPLRDNMVRTMKQLLNNVLGGAGRDFKHETGKGLLGDALHRSLLSSHAATIEFLRQFWSAVVTPQSAVSVRLAKQEDLDLDAAAADLTTPAQRRTRRAVRMAGILAKTGSRVKDLREQVQKEAAVEDVDAALAFVDRSLQPTMKSVERALYVSRRLYSSSQ